MKIYNCLINFARRGRHCPPRILATVFHMVYEHRETGIKTTLRVYRMASLLKAQPPHREGFICNPIRVGRFYKYTKDMWKFRVFMTET